jgi:hypothetical protein
MLNARFKLIGAAILLIFIAASAANAQSLPCIWPFCTPPPNITLNSTHAELSFDRNNGFIADCTVELVNTGEGDGVSTLTIMTTKGTLLYTIQAYVPKRSKNIMRMEADIKATDLLENPWRLLSGLDIEDKLRFEITYREWDPSYTFKEIGYAVIQAAGNVTVSPAIIQIQQ